MSSDRARLEVLKTDVLALIQDAGRPGFAHLGVTGSGAADRGAFDAANRLVGNMPGAACIETVFGGVVVRATATVLVAVTGAASSVVIDGDAGGTVHPTGFSLVVFAGQTVTVQAPERGLRNYIAVRGGIDVEPELGSRSTDVLSGLGPAALRPGTVLPVGRAFGEWSAADFFPREFVPVAPGPVVLRLMRGPRDDWFGEPGWAALTTVRWRVGNSSNRVGVRLEGGVRGQGEMHGESEVRRLPGFGADLRSEGMVPGAVQVPPNGQPVVFLRDHPTTGGYPVIGVLMTASIDALAQLRPGDEVRFAEP